MLCIHVALATVHGMCSEDYNTCEEVTRQMQCQACHILSGFLLGSNTISFGQLSTFGAAATTETQGCVKQT